MTAKELALRLGQVTALAASVYIGARFAEKPSIAQAHHDGDTIKNVIVGQQELLKKFHPITVDANTGEKKVWSYGMMLEDAALNGAAIVDGGEYGVINLTGAGDVGFNAEIGTQVADYKGDGARAAIWLRTGKNDQVYLMDADNKPVAMVVADDNGFAGILLSERVGQRFGIRVKRVNGADAVKANFGNLSKADAQKPQSSNVIDAAKVFDAQVAATPVSTTEPIPVAQPTATPPAEVKQAVPVAPKVEAKPANFDFLPQPEVRGWEESQGKGFFRPEGYTPFVQFAFPSSDKFTFKGSGSAGKFYALVRGAEQVKLEVKTFAPFADHLRQGKAAPALWLAGLQPKTRILLHDVGGNIVAEALADDAGYAGVQLADFDSQAILTLNFPFPASPSDVEFQMGPAEQAHLDKSSTLKLNGVDQNRLRRTA